jgi:uncharacterized membrane protein
MTLLSMVRPFLLAVAFVVLSVLAAGPAHADFRLCNNTSSRVGVSVGYRDQQGWLTEGWWNVSARSCEAILKGPLAARYYYVYAVDYDQGGEWSGQSFMCTRDKEFTIRGFENCLARGYDRSGFFEIDTGEQKSWTVQLSEQAQNGAKPKSDAPKSDAPKSETPKSETPKSNTPTSTPAVPPSVTPAPASPAAPAPAPEPAPQAMPPAKPQAAPSATPQAAPVTPAQPGSSTTPSQGTPAQGTPSQGAPPAPQTPSPTLQSPPVAYPQPPPAAAPSDSPAGPVPTPPARPAN